MPQFWCFVISVQCFVQFPHLVFFQSCVIPLIWFWRFCKQVLIDIRVQECRESSQPAWFSETTLTVFVKTSRAVYALDIDCTLSRRTLISLVRLSHDLPIVFESFSCQLPQTFFTTVIVPFLSVRSTFSAFPSSLLRSHQELLNFGISLSSFEFASGMFSSFVSMFTTFIKCSSTFMTSSSFLMSVFFSSLRFTGSSGGGTYVISRFGDFAINRLFTNTFSCVSVRFSPRLELDVAAVSGSGSVSPSIS